MCVSERSATRKAFLDSCLPKEETLANETAAQPSETVLRNERRSRGDCKSAGMTGSYQKCGDYSTSARRSAAFSHSAVNVSSSSITPLSSRLIPWAAPGLEY